MRTLLQSPMSSLEQEHCNAFWIMNNMREINSMLEEECCREFTKSYPPPLHLLEAGVFVVRAMHWNTDSLII